MVEKCNCTNLNNNNNNNNIIIIIIIEYCIVTLFNNYHDLLMEGLTRVKMVRIIIH